MNTSHTSDTSSIDTNATYLLFSAEHDRTDAVQCFVARFHQNPLSVVQTAGHLWVGPVPDETLSDQEKQA